MPLLGELVENFRGPTLDTTKWTAANSAGNSGFQAGGQYTFIVQKGATGDATLTSNIAYDLTDSHVHVELIDAGIQENGLETYPIILTQNPANQDNSFLIVVSNGLVGIYEFNGGVPNGLAFPSYDPVAMRWWEITEEAGVVYFNSAPDVRGPWTTRAQVTASIAFNALYMKMRVFDFLALSTAKQVAMSNVNYIAPPDIDFPNGALETGMELAFGADLYGDQTAWTWTDLTPPNESSLFMNQTVTPRRGRSNEAGEVSPTQATIRLDNPSGDLTPDNPISQYWPNVKRGTPGRWWIKTLAPRLYLQPVYGSRARVASDSALDLTADLDVRVDLHLKTTHPAGWNAVVAGRAVNGGPYSWRFEVRPDRKIELFWSTDGTTAQTVISTVEVLPSSARATIRATLDVDNGAGGHVVTFYVGYEGVNGTFTQMGPAITGTGTTSINNAAADLIIGSPPEIAGLFALDADVYHFQLRDGINGTPIVDADFTAQVSGVPAFVDDTGLVWNIEGATTELSNRHVRMFGTADSIAPYWPIGDKSTNQLGGIGVGEARVDFMLAGMLRRINQSSSLLESPLKRAFLAHPDLKAYWPLEDEEGASIIASATPDGIPMTFSGVINFEENTDLVGSKPLPTFTPTTAIFGAVTGSFNGHFQVEWYMYVPSGLAGQVFLMYISGVGGRIRTWKIDTSTVNVGVVGLDATGTQVTSGAAAGTEFFDRWVRARFVANQSGADIAWNFTWYPVQYPAHTGWQFSGSVSGAVGDVTAVYTTADADAVGIKMGHIAVLDANGSDTTQQAAVGWIGDTAAERIIRLCAEQGILLRLIGVPANTAKMGVQQIASLKTLLDDARAADGGILYEIPDALGLIYRTRESLYNQPANMVLDARQEQLQNPFQPVLDDQRLHNQVTVSRRGGSSYVAQDTASIDENGLYPDSITLNLFQDTQLADAAGWRLHQGTTEGMRYPSLVTNLGVAPEIIDQWLTVDIGGQVHAVNLPPQHPNSNVEVIVEGFSEPISPHTWVPQMNCSPAKVWDVAVLDGAWVDPEHLLRLDTDGTELALAVDDNDTTFIGLITDGPFWVTGAAEFPFDIEINGERVTFTAISPPSGATEFVGAGAFEIASPTPSFVAPSVTAAATGDLLICAWCSWVDPGTYTLPAGMFSAARTDATYTSMEDATQVLGSPGATGTRTAIFSSSDVWSAISLVAHSALGTPGVQEFLSGVDTDPSGNAQPVTLTTILPVAVGDWLLAIQSWDWDPGNNMGPPSGSDWIPIADSLHASGSTSRTRAWARRITTAGTYAITFPVVDGINDNHARLYTLTGVTGITQQFTVIRSVNGVVRSHPRGTPFSLWFTPVLAR